MLNQSAARADELLSFDIPDFYQPGKRGRVTSKGGSTDWVHWQTGTALLLPACWPDAPPGRSSLPSATRSRDRHHRHAPGHRPGPGCVLPPRSRGGTSTRTCRPLEKEALGKLLAGYIAIQPTRLLRRRPGYTNGRHRITAMFDSGVRRTIVRR